MANSSPHVIRLQGPWEYELLDRAGGVCHHGKFNWPADWSQLLQGRSVDTLRLTRRFNSPSGLQPSDAVHVVVESSCDWSTVRLNGGALAGTLSDPGERRFDLRGYLQPRNMLQMEVRLAPGADLHGLVTAVRLEILAS